MSTTCTYQYVVLRYVHDTTSGEFINVGVALHAPDARFAGALCRPTYGRLSKVFPSMNPEHFKSLMRYIQAQFDELGTRLADELPLHGARSIEELTQQVLPADDSSLQWSAIGSGRTANPAQTLEALFERMVMRYDDKPANQKKSEDDVWRHFKRTLETRQLLQYFEPKTVAVADDELNFDYTWKNGSLHCLEPVSFDLANPDSIHEKAHRWFGRIASLTGADAEPFKVYFLVGRPQNDQLEAAYKNALSILSRMPGAHKVFEENQVDEFGREVADEVKAHLSAIQSAPH